MTITAGIDVGSGAVKAVVMHVDGDNTRLLSQHAARIRRRTIDNVVDEAFGRAVHSAGVDHIDYIATTGEGEKINFATGHFYGMTTHARGALFLEPRSRSVLDVGALHARAVAMDHRGKVLNYKMTSQCASGSGQFLENIARYLGVSQAEVGPLSLNARDPETVSSICAVLAETDVINMVSRGIQTEDILRGIHMSMAGRFARLIRYLKTDGVVFLSGGLASDVGLRQALADALAADKRRKGGLIELVPHEHSIHAGAIGAAIWGAFRHHKLDLETAWTSTQALPTTA
ncbi:MAG: benzoyl-CoA reductase subunit D [Kiritimatiellia bacterium]|jgi:benzoyl-CoA reductase subunit D